MIKIAYSDVSDLDLSQVYNLLPESRKEKVNNFKFDKDKKLSAGAYILLNKMLEEKTLPDPNLKLENMVKHTFKL